MVGAIAPLGDFNKLRVRALAHYINEIEGDIMPQHTLIKPPSADLEPGQTDEATFGASYDVVAPLVDLQLNRVSLEELYARYEREIVARLRRLLEGAEFKRRQAPFSIRVTNTHFGSDIRLPL
ncbi:hypothetical protein HZA75_01470 [Candidatus Roizmanbacteria bacterium]|nr:hypothetical protein [Candidatus Roizmanbacteria bacterium]